MSTSIVLAAALAAAHPAAQRFLAQHPASARLASPDGAHLVHASGFLAETGAATPEGAARTFLALHGTAFGVGEREVLAVVGAPAKGRTGAVRVTRSLDGLPVVGGDLTLGVDAGARVFVVNASAAGPASGRHLLGPDAARAYALTSVPGGFRGEGPARVTAGWSSVPGGLRAAYRVDFVAAEPPGDWRVLVDAETGATLLRRDRRVYATAPGLAYDLSPVESRAAPCPVVNGVHVACESPVAVTLQDLTSTASLDGTWLSVFNCKGADAPTGPLPITGTPAGCSAVSSVAGAFSFPVDPMFASATDDFAAVMAYDQLDRHVAFFKALDPALPPAGNGRALSAAMPTMVNAFRGGVPFENAFYSPGLDAMVFGQGANLDYAYDATIAYHEFTHAVVTAWGDFNPTIDALGAQHEAGALHEGTADSMAASEIGRSEAAAFAGARLLGTTALRDLADLDATRSCRGDGTLVTQLGFTGVVNGLDGEVHDDGEIWNGLYWEIFSGLRDAGVKGCGGACEAGPAIQYLTLQLAAGGTPSLASYASTFQGAASALFPARPEVAAYAGCVLRRRGFDRCDRTVPVFAGEAKVQLVEFGYSPFQVAIDVTDPTTARLGVCSAQGNATTLWLRMGQPVGLTAIDPLTGRATPVADASTAFQQACSAGLVTLAPFPSAGRWYVLLDAPAAFVPAVDRMGLATSRAGIVSRPAPSARPTCQVFNAALAITPSTLTVYPAEIVNFTASGGSGTGYTFGFVVDASGGTLGTNGSYVAGPTTRVIDLVRVTDSLGATATATVSVVARPVALAISPVNATVAPGGSITFAASGGSGAGYAFALAANASGATISPAGAYVAGPTDGVTDIVRVTDSLGATATTTVTVSAAGVGLGGT
ncbi:MAG TPA: hypothetical protein VFP65_11850, partial [Anaeromyxobacteraceae bacterium]|nr:hypothetical protein [Anaeromyxobacteraceae bacterium]